MTGDVLIPIILGAAAGVACVWWWAYDQFKRGPHWRMCKCGTCFCSWGERECPKCAKRRNERTDYASLHRN